MAFGPFKSDYFYAPRYTATLEGSANQDVQGQTLYYQIFYNHRFVFVKAEDVMILPSSSRVYLPIVHSDKSY